jgi:hypothetical protein
LSYFTESKEHAEDQNTIDWDAFLTSPTVGRKALSSPSPVFKEWDVGRDIYRTSFPTTHKHRVDTDSCPNTVFVTKLGALFGFLSMGYSVRFLLAPF